MENTSLVQKQNFITPSEVMKNFNKEDIGVIKNTVAKNVTDAELAMFLTLASRYNLDPFRREIWCIKYEDREGVNIMTSRDGYLKIAQSNPDYLGLKSFVVREGDEFEIDAENDSVKHKFGAKRGKIIGAWAACYRKGKKPSVAFVEYSEYKKNNKIWNTYPSSMIQKVAETFVLKRQFGISGLVTQEEIDAGEEPINITPEDENINETESKASKAEVTKNTPSKNTTIQVEETKNQEPKIAEGPPAKLFKVLGLRPSPANKNAYELALADQKENKGTVFVLGDMVQKILEELGLEDIIKAKIIQKNGIHILESYTLTQKSEEKKETKTSSKDKNSTVELLGIGQKENVLALKLKGKEEFLAYTDDKELINLISQELIKNNAGPGSKVSLTLTQKEDGKIFFTSFKLVETKKAVSA